MITCFVMQAFDDGAYDTRYKETFAPAIQAGGAIPVRADKILGTKPIIDKIESSLRDATIALAEISENNPNVFTELGFALNLKIPLVLICDRAKRTHLPFDISHRPVIFYSTDSQGAYAKLAEEIQVAIGAAILEASERALEPATQSVQIFAETEMDELKQHILLEVLEGEMGNNSGLSGNRIQIVLAAAGISQHLTSLALLSLLHSELLVSGTDADYNGDSYTSYVLSESGRKLLLSRYAEIKRSEENRSRRQTKKPAFGATADLSDDNVKF